MFPALSMYFLAITDLAAAASCVHVLIRAETLGRGPLGTGDEAEGQAVCCSNEHCSASVTASATATDRACTCGGVRGVLLSAIDHHQSQRTKTVALFVRMRVNSLNALIT